jgi:arylsulfatase A-like enzyme
MPGASKRVRPNVLLFLPDGLQARLLAADSPCHIPNFRKLVDRGVQVTHAHTPLPTCSPARASLMTGLLPHNHGMWQVEQCAPPDQCLLRDRPHWAQRLKDSGYRTGYFGKWHIERSDDLRRFGWDEDGGWHGARFADAARDIVHEHAIAPDPRFSRVQTGPEGYRPYLHYTATELPLERMNVSVPVTLAGRFLDDALTGGQPWCCAVSFSEPNESLIATRDALSHYDIDDIDLPPNFDDGLGGRPALYRRAQRIWKDMTRRQWQELRACYYARVTELDALFGRLMDRIERAGQIDDTIVILSSDHGRYSGAHGLDGHNIGAFEEIYRIPMVVAGGSLPRGVPAHARVALQDLCPTILELAGLPTFGGADSTSFAALLRRPPSASTPLAKGFAEYNGNRYLLSQRVAWDDHWKLVFNGFDEDELYDLEEDPHELRNIAAGDPSKVEALMRQIWQRVRETRDQPLSEAQYYTYRFPALGPDA